MFILRDEIVYEVDLGYELQPGEIELPNTLSKFEIHAYLTETKEDHSFYHAFGLEERYSYEYELEEIEWNYIEETYELLAEGYSLVEAFKYIKEYVEPDETYYTNTYEGVEVDDKLYIIL